MAACYRGEDFIGTQLQFGPHVCPVCLTLLDSFPAELRCSTCQLSFQIVNGIPIFAEHPESVYGTMPRLELEHLLHLCQERGWDRGVTAFLQAKSLGVADFWARYFTPESRAAGRLLLPANSKARVLDLGCGIGPLSINLARYFDEVVGVDRGFTQLLLLKIRTQQARIGNLRLVCAGDRPYLPFPAEQFDIVFLNGVLEWVGTRNGGNPRVQQRDFLREVNRILKPKGEIYLGIENRIALKYLLGEPDEHTKLRFVTLLPRKLANLLSMMKKGEPYRVYTYSRWGYRKLLHEAGFDAVKFFLPRSNYRKISQIHEGENNSVSAEAYREKPCLRKMKRRHLKALAYPYLTHSYSIVVGKSRLSPSLIEEAVAKLEAWLKTDVMTSPKLRPALVKIGATSVALISIAEKHGARGFMLRIPLTPPVVTQQLHNMQNLRNLIGRLGPTCPLKDLLPEPVVTLDCSGIPVFVERLCPGFDLRHCYHPQDQPAVFRLGLDFLLSLNRELNDHRTHSLAAVEAWLRKREMFVYRTAPDFPAGGLQTLIDEAIDSVRLLPLPVVCSHGDFWPGNLLTDSGGDRLTGIVDWEFADQEGMPLLDLLQLLLYTKGLFSGKGFTRSLVDRLLARRFADDERPFIEDYCHKLGISDRLLWPLVFMAWLDWVYRRANVHCYLPSWRRNEMDGFLEASGEMSCATA
jgi:SAM-dependent methyltransferase